MVVEAGRNDGAAAERTAGDFGDAVARFGRRCFDRWS